MRTLTEQIERRLVMERLLAGLAVFFGGVAIFLAALGLYGVLASAIGRRTTEIGIRLALGASRASAVRLVLRDVLLIGTGAAVGLPCALGAGKLVTRRLYGLGGADPVALAAAASAILSAALLA